MSRKKVIITSLISLLIGTGLGMILLGRSCSGHLKEVQGNSNNNVEIPNKIIEKELKEIDSLKNVIELGEKEISRLKDSIKVKEVIRTIQIDNVKKLPLDSAVIFLNSKLREYEDKY